ncbi:MAG: hypothetical protein VXY56_09840, partial [Pseudomonadota bacterium]|nr:hypothetical protein [Pseudomonadota bacterium]
MSRDIVSRMLDNIVESAARIETSMGDVVDFTFGGDGFHPQHLEMMQLALRGNDLKDDEYVHVAWDERVSWAQEFVSQSLLQTTRGEVPGSVRVPWNPRRSVSSRMEMDGHAVCCSIDDGWTMVQEWMNRFERLYASRGMETNWFMMGVYLMEFRPGVLCRMTRDSVGWMLEHSLAMIDMGFVCEGDMMGSITGMAVGQPIVQMTMNTIHTTGGTESVLNEGMDELRQIFGRSSGSKAVAGGTLGRIFLEAPWNFRKEMNEYVCMRLMPVTMRDVCQSWSVEFDESTSRYALLFVLDQESLLRHDLLSYDVFDVLSKSLGDVGDVSLEGDVCDPVWICRVLCNIDPDLKDVPREMSGFAYQLGDLVWSKFHVSKCMGIGNCTVLRGVRRPNLDAFETRQEYEIVARSSVSSNQLWESLLRLDWVDGLRTYCSNLDGISQVLGIE